MNTGTAVITGASSGLGLQCARALLRRDASWHVVLAVRDPARGRAAMEELGEPNRCSVLEVDLASVRSVRSFVETVRTTPLPPIVPWCAMPACRWCRASRSPTTVSR